MKMPDKDPGVWLIIWAYLQQNYNAIAGFVMAFFMSILRALFLQQKSSYRRRVLDGAICGALTLSCMSLLNFLGMPENLAVFAGGMLGFIGAEKIREFLFRFISTKVGKDE
ncbi:phage holin, lambda family [Gallibacterium salpingitidis]|uniref:phage holin, lambda family n=1 Tax=Gallibacterium salpingitidis TaxID=505341 RepID=UPI00266E9F69|nr:phage holin, lambda family [Gallibacterium salpingitidis]WKS98491.1 phage holin, lambda family [Gallibacterium salpingitidis]